jgi:hypothetical protein
VAHINRAHVARAKTTDKIEQAPVDKTEADEQAEPVPVEALKIGDTPPLQRDDDTATAEVPTITIDGIQMSYCRDLVSWYKLHILKLDDQKSELQKDKAPWPYILETAAEEGKGYQKDCEAKQDEPIDTGAALTAQIWFDHKYAKAMNEAEAVKAEEAAKNVKKNEAHFKKVKEDIEQNVIPGLRDVQRAGFRSSDESKLLQVADTIMTAVDCALTLGETAKAIAEDVATLENMANHARGYKGVVPTVNTKVNMIVELADKINKGYAAFQLLRAGIDLLSPQKTATGGAAAGVKAMSTVVSAGGTLLGASAGMTLYANLYIGPMVDACLKLIAKIEDMRSRSVNRVFIEMGEFDSVNWLIEPGGRPVFDFMLAVMHADGPEGVPSPVPKTVSQYFVDNEDDLKAGTGGKELPTKGWWLWKKVDDEKITRWVFYNRDNLWGMLYGAARVP